jgi:hypothetical protein
MHQNQHKSVIMLPFFVNYDIVPRYPSYVNSIRERLSQLPIVFNVPMTKFFSKFVSRSISESISAAKNEFIVEFHSGKVCNFRSNVISSSIIVLEYDALDSTCDLTFDGYCIKNISFGQNKQILTSV